MSLLVCFYTGIVSYMWFCLAVLRNKAALHLSTYKSTSCLLTVSIFDAEEPKKSFTIIGIDGIWVVSSVELLQWVSPCTCSGYLCNCANLMCLWDKFPAMDLPSKGRLFILIYVVAACVLGKVHQFTLPPKPGLFSLKPVLGYEADGSIACVQLWNSRWFRLLWGLKESLLHILQVASCSLELIATQI